MHGKKLVGKLKRTLTGVLVLGLVLTSMPTFVVEAANEALEEQPHSDEVKSIPQEDLSHAENPETEREIGMPVENGEHSDDERPGDGENSSHVEKPGNVENGLDIEKQDNEENGSEPGRPGDKENGSDAEKPGDGENESDAEKPGDGENISDAKKPGGGENDSDDERPDDEVNVTDENITDDMESVPDDSIPSSVYHVQISGNDISENDISGNDLSLYEEDVEGMRVVGGYMELPEDRNISVVDDGPALFTERALPESYIPETGTLPATRSQGSYGSCWAFTSMALAEIDMMKKSDGASSSVDFSDIDLSELHLAYFSYSGTVKDPLGGLDGDVNTCTGDFLNRGGNLNLAKNVLVSWVGAADESTAPYVNAAEALEKDLDPKLAFDDVVHLQNYYGVNLQENREIAKQMILDYGGVGTSYNDNDSSYNSDNNCYYDDEAKTTNHAVTIVGWDDTFSASNFTKTPEGDGAWLIRNSWLVGADTDSRTRSTYFWMSYYDKTLSGGHVFDFEEANTYQHNYQYDGSMQTEATVITTKNPSVRTANVFTAKAHEGPERLEAVGIGIYKAQTPYTISIYINPTDPADPESGELIEEATTSGSSHCEGFYTVELEKPVILAPGDVFAVVVDIGASERNADNNNMVYLAKEATASSWYQCKTAAKAGQSFYVFNGSWKDYGADKGANLRIKAYTVDDNEGPESPEEIRLQGELQNKGESESKIEIGVGETYQASCLVLPRNAKNRKVLWESANPSIATVGDEGLITGVSAGDTTITVTSVADASVQVSFSVKIFSELRITIKGADSVEAGKTASMQAVLRPTGSTEEIKWNSSDERVLTVDEEGTVTGIAPGYATITASAGTATTSKELTCELPSFTWSYTASANGLRIQWPGAEWVKSYRLNRAVGSNNWANAKLLTEIQADGKSTYFYLDKDVEGGKEYVYEVEAVVDYIKGSDTDKKTKSTGRYKCTMPYYYPITYHLDGGTNDSGNPAFYRAGQTTYLYDGVEKTGYLFAGWYYDEALTQEVEKLSSSSTIARITSDKTGAIDVYAKWVELSKKITYELDGGENSPDNPSTYVSSDGSVTLKEAVKKGYDFQGWYTESTWQNRMDALDNSITGDITLYAKWQLHTYIITYETAGGTHANPTSYTIETPSVILQDAVRKGYRFDGWYTDPEYQFPMTEIPIKSTGDILLYAKWIVENTLNSAKIILHADTLIYTGAEHEPQVNVELSGTVLEENQDYILFYADNKNAGTATVTAKGIGIYHGSTSTSFAIIPAKVLIKAKNKTIQIGDAVPEEGAYEYEVSGLMADDKLVTAPRLTCDITAADTAKTGQYVITLSGADAGSNYAITYEEGLLTVSDELSEEYVLCQVVFDMQGHGMPPTEIHDVKTGSKIDRPAEPVADGYQFAGWFQDAACTMAWDFDTDIVKSDMTLYAKWVKKNADGNFLIQEMEDTYYTGKPQKPVVHVYDGETLLKAGRDYTIKYCNNINANQGGVLTSGSGQGSDFNASLPYVQITGKGNYTDVVKVNFNICPVVIGDGGSIPADQVKFACTDQFVLARKALKPFKSIKYITSMKKGKDYKLTLSAVDARDDSGNAVPEGMAFHDAVIPAEYDGEFLLTVTGSGNYAGSISKNIYVASKWQLIKNTKITLGKNQKNRELIGDKVELTPALMNSPETFTVKSGNTVLVPGVDYKTDYRNNDRVGKAELIITGIGEYVGTKTVNFRVTGKPFTAKTVMVTGVTDKSYTGEAIIQDNAVLVYGSSTADERKLTCGTDYTVSYSKNINKGTATIIFTGSKNTGFEGSFKKSFKITAEQIAKVDRADGMDAISVSYSKTGAKPVAEIVLTNANGIRLQYGKDYTLGYKNNRAVAKATDLNAPTIIVKGKGNYQGSFDIPFTITKADLRSKLESGDIVIKTKAVAYQKNKAGNYAYKPGITLIEGKTALRAGTDYEITYRNNTQSDYETYIQSLNSRASDGSIIPAPKVVITVTPDSNYRITETENVAEIEIPLPVYQYKLTKSNLKVEIQKAIYTGTQVKPDVTVTYQGETGSNTLVENKDYTVSYGTNIKSGKKAGSMTISGLGPYYGGDVTVKFEIQRKKIKY